jgi:hypothetical protein
MRAALFALLALGATSVLHVAPAAAQPRDPGLFSFYTPSGYPFCMRTLWGDDDCSYRTYAQCTTTASGLGLDCFANPAGVQVAPQSARPRKRKNRNSSY